MNMFSTLPDDLDYSLPIEPMRLDVVGDQGEALRSFISHLIDTHPTKLKKKERDRLRDAYRQILLNVLYNSIRRVYTGVSRRKEAYNPGGYWRSLGLTYTFTVAVLDRLADEGYIEIQPGFLDRRSGIGRLTRIFAKPKLAEKIDAYSIAEHIQISSADEMLILRDFNVGGIVKEDHPDLERLRIINNFLDGFNWPQKGPIRLIYNSDPLRGGRLYTRFQNLKRELRAQITISGKPTVELDFKANHLSMLITMVGGKLSPDPYLDIALKAGQTRDKVKRFITVALGADNEDKASAATRQYGISKERFLALKNATNVLFPKVTLFAGIGVSLQSLEGQIALDIMVEGAQSGVPVLPVHDSFITTAENENWLRDQMVHFWRLHVDTLSEPRIDRK